MRPLAKLVPLFTRKHQAICRASTQSGNIVHLEDKKVFAVWHPTSERGFPYEFTQPFPEEAKIESDSPLKLSMSQEVMQVFKPKNEQALRQELMALTYTTKHRWYPRGRDKRAKKTLPDRPYL